MGRSTSKWRGAAIRNEVTSLSAAAAVTLSFHYRDYSNAKYVGVYKMSTPSLLVRDLDLVHNVMSRNFGSFEQNDFVVLKEQDSLLYENPFCKTGTDWKEGRALVTPLLTISKVKTMFPGVKNACDKLGLYLSSCAEKEFEGKLVSGRIECDSGRDLLF